jgi:hypothetical protein
VEAALEAALEAVVEAAVEAVVEADVGAESGAEAGIEAVVEEKVLAEEERPGEGGAREVCAPSTAYAIVAKKASRYASPKSPTAITTGRSNAVRSESGTPSRS